MPKRRVKGAAKPYTYWTTYTVKGPDGTSEKRRTQRWKQQVEAGYDGEGRRIRKTFTGKTSREVTAKVREYMRKTVENGGQPYDDRAKFGTYAKAFLEAKSRELTPNSIRIYKTVVNRHLAPLTNEPISSLRHTRMQNFINGLTVGNGKTTKQASESVKALACTVASQIFEMAVSDGIIARNPMRAVKPNTRNRHTAKPQEPELFTVEEMTLMLKHAAEMDIRDGAIWIWRLLTGMRQSEILGARTADLSIWEEVVTVPQTIMRETMKDAIYTDENGNERHIKAKITEPHTEQVPTRIHVGSYQVNWQLQPVSRRHGCPKTENGEWSCGTAPSRCPDAIWNIPDGYAMEPCKGRYCFIPPKSNTGRIVPILPQLAETMLRYQNATRDIPNPHGLIFREEDGSPIVTVEDTSRFKQFMRDSGIDPTHHRGHQTRHSVVTLLRSMGVDDQLVAEIVGHSSIKMVEHYRHADMTERLKAMETLEQKLNLKSIDWNHI